MKRRLFLATAIICLLGLAGRQAPAFEFQPQKVAEGVYALIGETGPRTAANHALNANMGFVVTREGVALIDSGASPAGAEIIEKAIRTISDKPVRWIFNTGSQDHRWLGNGYFAGRGAKIIALARTVTVQRQFAESHVQRLSRVLESDEAAAIVPMSAPDPAQSNRIHMVLGGVSFELAWLGDAHFPGDAVVWLPGKHVMFTGDMVYVDRMLGVQEVSRVTDWRQAFHNMAKFAPQTIVPGHGGVSDLAKAQRDTGDYLDWLVDKVAAALADWRELDDTVKALENAPRFQHLEHYDGWHRTNINRTYLFLEARQ